MKHMLGLCLCLCKK